MIWVVVEWAGVAWVDELLCGMTHKPGGNRVRWTVACSADSWDRFTPKDQVRAREDLD